MRLAIGRTACKVAIGALVFPLFAHALDPEKLFEKVSPSAWGVVVSDAKSNPFAIGSAVVIGPGRLVTNCHVVKNAKRIQVVKDNVTYGAAMEFADAERDLCQLKVANFHAPAVEIVPTQSLKIGQKVFAIGNPQGLELTFSEGLISSLRQRDEKGLPLIQTTAPVSPGSSGGGLFDSEGRLVGIITFGLKAGQNLNFAHPASWIAEIEERSKAAVAKLNVNDAAAGAGATWVYELTDRLTRMKRKISYRVERVDAKEGRVSYNQGTRVENMQGKVIEISAFDAGDFDLAMPPGGWVGLPLTPGKTWNESFKATSGVDKRYQLTAKAIAEEVVSVPAGEFTTMRIEWSGYATEGTYNTSGPYKATVWYSVELGRVIKFTAESGFGQVRAPIINEMLVLVQRPSN